MKKPLIGVIPQYDAELKIIRIAETYFKAIQKAGGVPFLFPLHNEAEDLDALLDMADGFVYPGGPDIHPKYFGEEIVPEYGVILPERDTLELKLFSKLYQTGKPMFGICRGIQTMNVALHGSIVQDIPSMWHGQSRVGHYQKSRGFVATHKVKVEKDSLLYDIVHKENIEVNSFHHQSVKEPGEHVSIAATAPDGIIEGIYVKEHPFFLGVQWHPEDMYDTDEDSRKLFEAFIQACR